jgi:hypothetical protein
MGQYVDRYAVVSVAGYALAVPAAFLSPPVALALVFLTTVLARTVAQRVLTPSAPDTASEPAPTPALPAPDAGLVNVDA